MNRYGQMTMTFSRLHRPVAFASLEDPEAFFTTAGEEIAAQVEATMTQLQESRAAGERLTADQARRTAEEVVLADHWLMAPEPAAAVDLREDEDPAVAQHYRDLAEMNAAIHQDW